MVNFKIKQKLQAQGGVIDDSLTASQIVETDASKNLVSAAKATAYNKAFETDTGNIKMNGSVAVGSSDNVARADHVHASDTSKLGTALTETYIFVGNGSGVATGVAVSGEATIANTGAITLANSAVIGKLLTGYTAGAGAVAATDNILAAIQKVDGNDALKATKALDNLASVAINTSLISDTDNTDDLGSAAIAWKDIYLAGKQYFDSNSQTTSIAGNASASASVNYQLPAAAPTANDQVLAGSTAGVMSWKTVNLASAGDINETSFAMADNVAVPADITGFAFANATVRSFKALVSVFIDATADLYEAFEITGIQKGAGWDMVVNSVGDDSGVVFSITAAGQLQYTSPEAAGYSSSVMKFRAHTTSV